MKAAYNTIASLVSYNSVNNQSHFFRSLMGNAMIRGRVQNGVILINESATLPDGTEVRVEVLEPQQPRSAVELIDQWLEDDSGYDEQTWPELKTDLDADRLSARRFFNGEAGSP